MLFKQDEFKGFLDGINEYILIPNKSGLASGHTPYEKELIRQVRALVNESVTLQVPSGVGDFFDEHRNRILVYLNAKVTLESLRQVHFRYAEMLRRVTLFGSDDFNDHEAVKFYLVPKFEEVQRGMIDSITFGLPAEFASRHLKLPLEKLEKQFNAMDAWDTRLVEWEGRVIDSEKRYREVLNSNNYLGLAHAFTEMTLKKEKEVAGLRAVMVGLGLAAFLIPVLQLFLGNLSVLLGRFNLTLLSTAVFSIAAEVILIYFFRIVHQRWASVKSQIAQLELRHAMCAFVQDYAEKSKDLDRSTLAKFENMIFAEVTQDMSAPPSIYDAADSIAKLLGAWKKPGP